MQWYRHDHVELASSETLIVKRCAEPTCHETSQVNLTPVLKVVNDLANNTAAAVRGHCRIEVDCAMRAVGACERGRNRKSTRLNSSHVRISYADSCLKKK